MAVVTRGSAILPSVQRSGYTFGQPQHAKKWTWHSLRTQIATLAISLTLFTTVRLPKESARYGAIPYLVVYTFWLLVVGLPTVLLQLSMGQLSRQDAVGVWRAVPIFRGVGHLRLLTSYLCCVYYMIVTSLSTAYILWIAKGTFPLKDCTRLYITPRGYENKMNATECFNSTFLAPFTEHPQYLGIMAILIFILWFFVPTLLYRLQKTIKMTYAIVTPLIIFLAIFICSYIGQVDSLDELVMTYVRWQPLKQPFIWQSSLIQVLLSTQIASGYLTSTGGTVYSHADVRWTTVFLIITNLVSSWLWVFFWESISVGGMSDRSFVGVLVLIYESSVNGRRFKLWPMLSFFIVFLSGIITILALLFPVYDKLQRITGDHWRLFATVLSAIGTALSVIVLIRGLGVTAILDDMVVPVIAAFVTAVEVVGFVFIYGWHHIMADIEFLTKSKVPSMWVFGWWLIPVILIAMCGWWIRVFLRVSIEQDQDLWPLFGIFVGMLLIMIVTAAVAVAKEEQFNLLTKIAAAFKPSRLWGPEEPLSRYMWMSQKYVNEDISSVNIPKTEELFQRPVSLYDMTAIEKHTEDRRYNDLKNSNDIHQRLNDINSTKSNKEIIYSNINNKNKKNRPKVCLATGELGITSSCDCGRHFKLNVPHLEKGELTTSL